jgi:ribosomal protein L37E
MSENSVEITCARCGHAWEQDLTGLAVEDQVMYRGQVRQQDYRLRCPRCGTNNIVSVEFEEVKDG